MTAQIQKSSLLQRIQVLVQTWDALQLSIQNDGDGLERALGKRQSLCEELVSYMTEYGDRVDVDDLVDFYDAFFADVFDIQVQDGSIDQYAELSLALYNEYSGSDQDPVWKRVQAMSESKVKVNSDIQMIPDDHMNGSPDIVMHNDIEMSGNAAAVDDMSDQMAIDSRQTASQKAIANQPDEDGWITVTRKSKGRNV
ncbi:hypothetical protein MIR68_005139 [Amoeboaphelidium protococcarum]|nr:hypothetical protein MIR68_005139 [Amoeboaphelidium protococcarum]